MLTEDTMRSRIHGCWLGKSIGGTLGIPTEGAMERLHMTFYDPIPTEAPPNDDLELQLVWLHMLETRGLELTQRDFADAWQAHIHYMWDEFGRCRWNLRRGVPLAEIGTFENPFRSSMGSPIRSEIWACVAGGNPDVAARYAALDSSLDHGLEGIAGEVFLAVLQTLVLAGNELNVSLRRALELIDSGTETAWALNLVFHEFDDCTEAWTCRDRLLHNHNSENFTHAPLNVALSVWALLYGAGDFGRTVLLAVNGGYDTDCTGATAGATLGLLLGREGIPDCWKEPIGDGVAIGPGLLGIHAPRTLTELTDRTIALANRLSESQPNLLPPAVPTGAVSLADLPGTIELCPIDGSGPVLFANGELPDAVKRAGGATWEWQSKNGRGKQHHLMALAKGGAKLYVDGVLVVDCTPGLPYVSAPHRCPKPSQALFTPDAQTHQMRVELGSRDTNQPSSVILSTANFHIAPWSGEMLPFAPILD